MRNTHGRFTSAPCGARSDWKDRTLCPANFTERPATTYSDAYRDFEVSGDVQNGVRIRVYGLENSDIPKDKGMQKIESLTGLVMTVGSVRSRGKSKDEIVFEAKKMKLAK